jgi:hypothetical protein
MRVTSYVLWNRLTEIFFENILRIAVEDIFKPFQCQRPQLYDTYLYTDNRTSKV